MRAGVWNAQVLLRELSPQLDRRLHDSHGLAAPTAKLCASSGGAALRNASRQA